MDATEMTDGATASEQVAPRSRRRRPAPQAAEPATNGTAAVHLLSAADILGAADVITEDVACPEWNGSVRMRGLTGRERDDYEISLQVRKADGTIRQQLSGARERLVSKCAVDAMGNRLFTDEQAAVLGQKNGRVIDRLFDVAARLSGLRNEDVERLAGNSKAAPSEGSA